MKTLYLCGASNPEGVKLALDINESQSRWDEIVILDDDPSKHGLSILGIKIAGPFSLLKKADSDSAEVSNLVARTMKGRWSALGKIQAYNLPFATLIDPGVDIRAVDVGKDITVYRGAHLCANATIDEGSVVFAGAIVGHRCRIGRCCAVAPGAVVNARVELSDGVYVGTNASILPDLKVGAWSTIGANSAVVQDVPVGATVMGVPAQLLMRDVMHLLGESSSGFLGESRNTQPSHLHQVQTEIESEALKKLRTAQERFMTAYRSKKS